jgi:uncharacterized membrane protein
MVLKLQIFYINSKEIYFNTNSMMLAGLLIGLLSDLMDKP